MMQYSKLGKSDLKVSRIGLGCMSLNGSIGENRMLIVCAIYNGINYFDTADLYEKGRNEIMLGKILKPYRQDMILATKVGNQWKADGSGWEWNPGKTYILKAVEESLRRLQTDYIDLYQLHGGTIDDPMDETIEAFELLKQQGKIRHYGISSIRPDVIRAYVKKSAMVSVMMQYSLLDRRPEEACFDLLAENSISVVTRGSVAQGLLVDKPAKPYLGWSADEVARAAEAVREVSADHGPAAETAARFVLQQPVVSSAVIGIRTLSQLEDIIAATDKGMLTQEEIRKLSQAAPPKFYTDHR